MVEQSENLVFEPAIVYAVVIINKEYGLTQANANNKLRYPNLGPVEQDLVRVRATLAILGIPQSNITVL